jgi:hypothetical protein
MILRDHRPDIRLQGTGPARGRRRAAGPSEAGAGWAAWWAIFGLCFDYIRATSGYVRATEIACLLVYFLAGTQASFAEQISRIKDLPCLPPRPAKRRGRRRFRPGPNLVQSSPAPPAAGLVPGLRLATGGRGRWQGPVRAACDAAGLGARVRRDAAHHKGHATPSEGSERPSYVSSFRDSGY